MENNKEIQNYILAAAAGAAILIVLRELFDKSSNKDAKDYTTTVLLGGLLGVGAYALSKRQKEETESPSDYYAPDVNSYTASTDNRLIVNAVKHLNNSQLLYKSKNELWFFDKATQKVVVASDSDSFSYNGFIPTTKFAYQSKKCYSKSLQKMLDDKDGVFYVDFSAEACAGFAIANVKVSAGFGIGLDRYGNVAIYGNYGALASYLKYKVSSYDSVERLWTIILGASTGVGVSLNYCPQLKTVKELFGLSYTAEFGVGMISIRIVYDNFERITGFGLDIVKDKGILGINYTDSRNKGLIISYDELPRLLNPVKEKLTIGSKNFNYVVDRNGFLNVLVPNYRFVTDIEMAKKKDVKGNADGDFVISQKANEKY